MPRYKAIVEYVGTPYYGWQRQPQGPSVQAAIEKAVSNFSHEKIEVYGAGRTDSGVHALGQVIHFDLAKDYDAYKVRDGTNHFLKYHPIAFLDVEKVDAKFHARFSAQARSYEYVMINRYAPLTLQEDRAWRIPQKLDVPLMQEAARHLVGTYDFSTFRCIDCKAASPVKTLDIFEVTQDQDRVIFFLKARSFLHHQVRNMVGTLKLLGLNQWTLTDLIRARDARDRRQGGPMAPPEGLYFKQAYYPPKLDNPESKN